MKLYNQDQLPVLIALLGFGIVFTGWIYLVMPTVDMVRANLIEKEKVTSQLDARNTEVNAIKKFKGFVQNEKDKIDLAEIILPKEPAMDDLLIQIEKVAVSEGVFLKNVNVKESTTSSDKVKKDVDELKVTYQLEGEYPNMLNYLDKIQDSTRLMYIDKFSATGNPETENQKTIYNVEMTLLYQK